MAEGGLTRVHWMPDSAINYCTNISCGAALSSRKKYNCRCCGNVFCGNCTKYSLPLDPDSAQIDYNGVWAKVCILCYNRGVEEGVLEGANSVYISNFSEKKEDEDSGLIKNEIFFEPNFYSRNQSFSHAPISKGYSHNIPTSTNSVSNNPHARSSSCSEFPIFDSPELPPADGNANGSGRLLSAGNSTRVNQKSSAINSESRFSHHNRSYSLLTTLDRIDKRPSSRPVSESSQVKDKSRPNQPPESDLLVRTLDFNAPSPGTNAEYSEANGRHLEQFGKNSNADANEFADTTQFTNDHRHHHDENDVDGNLVDFDSGISVHSDHADVSKDSSPLSNRHSNFDESFGTENSNSNLNLEVRQGFESDSEMDSQHGLNMGVGSWSVHGVCEWIKGNVAFGSTRVEEYVQLFERECVDGTTLLTLQRNHPACASMQPGDWLALKVSRRRLLAGLSRTSSLPYPTLDKNESEFMDEFNEPAPEDWQWVEEDSDWDEDTKCFSINPDPPTLNDHILSFPSEDSSKKTSWFSSLRGKSNADEVPSSILTSQNLKILIGMAEEKEAAVRSQLSHLDRVLRVSPMSSFLKVRRRWHFEIQNSELDRCEQPLEHHFMDDNNDKSNNNKNHHHRHHSMIDMGEEDWLPRFVVLQPPRIAFYLHAGDSKAEIAIPLHIILKCDYLSMHTGLGMSKNHFLIISNNGIRMECSARNHLQTELWVSSIRDCILSQSSFITSYTV